MKNQYSAPRHNAGAMVVMFLRTSRLFVSSTVLVILKVATPALIALAIAKGLPLEAFAQAPSETSLDQTRVKPGSIGEQRTAIFLLDFMNNSEEKPTPEEIEQVVFSAPKSLDAFVREISYGKTWLSGKVFGWYPVPGQDCELGQDELLAFISQFADLREFDRVLVFNYFDSAKCPGKHLGYALFFGKRSIDLPQGPVEIGLAQFNVRHRLARPHLPFQPLSGLADSVVSHEFVHSLGVEGHANLLECGEKSFGNAPTDCRQEPIADMFSIMGGEGFFRSATHPGACHKEALSWLNEGELLRLKEADWNVPGGVLLSLYPYEVKSENGPIALKLELPTPLKFIAVNGDLMELSALYLEYRRPLGFDSALDKIATKEFADPYPLLAKRSFSGDTIDIGGIQLRAGLIQENRCITSYLVDTHPGSLGAVSNPDQQYSLYDSLDSFLLPGNSVVEPNNKIRISVESIAADGSVQVRVEHSEDSIGN